MTDTAYIMTTTCDIKFRDHAEDRDRDRNDEAGPVIARAGCRSSTAALHRPQPASWSEHEHQHQHIREQAGDAQLHRRG